MKPELKLSYFDSFETDNEIDHISILFTVDNFPLRKSKRYHSTILKCRRYFVKDNEDYRRLKNLDIDKELLDKYFHITFSFINGEKNISFSDFECSNYKKFVLDNINKAIMEYSL